MRWLKSPLVRWISLLCVFISQVLPLYMVKADTDTLKVDLEIINLEADGSVNTDSEYWAGTPINAAADISVSGSGAKLESPWVVLTVPKTGKTSTPTWVDSANAQRTIRVLDDDNNWYIIYQFHRLNGGARFTFPFPFEFLDGTPNGFELPVTLSIYNDSGAVDIYKEDGVTVDTTKVKKYLSSVTPNYTTTKVYIAKRQEFPYNNSAVRQWGENTAPKVTEEDYNGGIYPYVWHYHVAAGEGDTHLGSKDVTTIVSWLAQVPSGTEGRINFIEPSNLKATLTLPATVNPPKTLPEGWSYDESTRQLTFFAENTVTDPSSSWNGQYYRNGHAGQSARIVLNYSNVPFNTEVDIPVTYTVDAGLPTEVQLPNRTFRTKFVPLYFNPYGGFEVFKDNLTGGGTVNETNIRYDLWEGSYTYTGDKIYDRVRDHTEHGLTYIGIVRASNNGSSLTDPTGGWVREIYRIQDILYTNTASSENPIYYKYFQLLPASSYGNSQQTAEYKKEKLDAANALINNENTVLYGVKKDGTRTVIKEHLQVNERIDIDDSNQEYIKLEVEFAKPIVLDNMKLEYVLQTYPTVAEKEKFDNGTYTNKQTYYGETKALAYETRRPDGAKVAEAKEVTTTTI